MAEKIIPQCKTVLHCHKSNRMDSYGGLSHTRMIPVLNNMTGFIRKYQYPNIDRTLESEWGGINNIRFFVSSQGSITSNGSMNGNDMANNFITAKEGYKVVKMSDHSKLSLIDLEAYGNSYGDRAQATERCAA